MYSLFYRFIQKILLKNEIIILCGFQNFPTKMQDSKLSQINYFKKKYDLEIGYADHIDSEDKKLREIR